MYCQNNILAELKVNLSLVYGIRNRTVKINYTITDNIIRLYEKNIFLKALLMLYVIQTVARWRHREKERQ